MPRQPHAFAWIAALLEAVREADVDGMRLALLLEGLVRSYSALAWGLTSGPPAGWLQDAVGERFPAVAHAVNRDWADAEDELDFAVDLVLRGVTSTSSAPPC